MKRIFTASFLIILLLNMNILPQEQNYKEGELIVQLKKGNDLNSLLNDFSYINLRVDKLLSQRLSIWLFDYNQNKISDDNVLFTIRQNKNVKIVQFNHYVQARKGIFNENTLLNGNSILSNFPDDPMFDQQWALNNTGQGGGTPDADIDAPEAWDISTGGISALGDSIVVAIVDGGCDLNHQDLNYWINYAEIPNNGIDDDGNGYIDDYRGWNAYDNNGNIPSDYHGTHVSGIAAAHGNNGTGVSGVNWNTKVMPIAGASEDEATVVAAYSYALEMRARYNESNGTQGAFVVVTNSSFGIDGGQPENYPIWCAMYDSLGVYGILSCAATANINWDIDINGDIPTACPSPFLISVTNTTRNDTKNSGAAYGLTTIDLGAPGTSILSTVPGNSYSNLTGTSMASPTVAGAVALMIAAADLDLINMYHSDPGGAALILKDELLAGTDTIPDLVGKTVTGGRLNAFNAVTAASNYVVPVELTSFTASTDNNNVILNWQTATETNNKGFEVERIKKSTAEGESRQGRKLKSEKWENIGFVDGYGTTTIPHSYSFTDKNVTSGKYNYRLRQIDLDGRFKYSKVVEASINYPGLFTLAQNYPNPFNPSTTIEFNLPKKSEVNLSVYNILGKLVKTLVNSSLESGHHKINFNAEDLPSGVYFYKLKSDSGIKSGKMILMK